MYETLKKNLGKEEADKILSDAETYLRDQVGIGNDDMQAVVRYIAGGMKEGTVKVIPKRGNDKTPCMISELSSVKGHNPWYSLKLKNPPPIFLGIFAHKRMKIYENKYKFKNCENVILYTWNDQKISNISHMIDNLEIFKLNCVILVKTLKNFLHL